MRRSWRTKFGAMSLNQPVHSENVKTVRVFRLIHKRYLYSRTNGGCAVVQLCSCAGRRKCRHLSSRAAGHRLESTMYGSVSSTSKYIIFVQYTHIGMGHSCSVYSY